MKLRTMALGLMMVMGMACIGADEATDQKEGAASFTCGGSSVSTENPSMNNVLMTWTFGGLTWHSNVKLLTDFQGKSEANGFAFFEIDRPTENPAGTWPLFTSGVRLNGTSIQAIMPAETTGAMYYFEGQTVVSGPFPGGSVSMSGLIYDGKHQLRGTFSTAVGVSGGVNQWLNGIPAVCASRSPQTLAAHFGYNLEVCCSANGPFWFTGTVTSTQPAGSAYMQLKLSDPHYQTHEAWIGDAACIIDPNNNLQCNVHTGQDAFSGDIGDPIWTLKGLSTGYMFQYDKEWDYETTGLYIDYFGY